MKVVKHMGLLSLELFETWWGHGSEQPPLALP